MKTLPLIIALAVLCALGGEAEAQGVGASLDVETIAPLRTVAAVVVYSAKFLCGTIEHDKSDPQLPPLGSSLVPGTYLTVVNVHNAEVPLPPPTTDLRFLKRAIETKPQGEPRGRISLPVTETLEAFQGMEINCQNIKDLLDPAATDPFKPSDPLVTGFVHIVLADRRISALTVVGVYTLKNAIPPPAP